MRKVLSVLVIVLAGCGGATGSSPTASAPTGGADNTPAAVATAPSDAPSAAAGALPADCAEGFSAYLVEIEPLVSSFDPATATLGDLSAADDAVGSKSMDLLKANDSTAPYSCPDVGLEWAYFDDSTPWDAVLAVAGDAAPGTVAYLTALRAWSNLDVATVSDYGVEGCEAAVAGIKDGVAAQTGGVEEMGLEDGLALLGLYRAYMRDVQDGVCAMDALGNDEFDFFGSMG